MDTSVISGENSYSYKYTSEATDYLKERLPPMIYKDYRWPHNPRIYEIEYGKKMAMHKVPFGLYILQNMGRVNRILRGEGEFAGESAYTEFMKLATVFYDDKPGSLIHPIWQLSNAYFVGLSLRQEPTKDYVSYTFEFWESYDGYETGTRLIEKPQEPEVTEVYYTAVWGDYMWRIATRNGLTLNELLALNPQVKNPNILYVGDVIRVR